MTTDQGSAPAASASASASASAGVAAGAGADGPHGGGRQHRTGDGGQVPGPLPAPRSDAVAGDDVQSVVDVLAARLGRSVAVDDPSLRLIAASRHFGDEDDIRVRSVMDRQISEELQRWVLDKGIAEWTRPGRVTGDPVFAAEPRICFPVRCNGMLLGFLWLIESGGPVDDEAHRAATDAVETISLILYRRIVLNERRRSRVESSLRMLLSPEKDDRHRAIGEIQDEQLLAHSSHVLVLVGEADGEPTADTALALEAAAEQMERRLPQQSVLTLVRQRRVVVVVGGARPLGDQAVRDLAERLQHEFGRMTASGRTCAIGVGATQPGLESVIDGYRQASTAVRAALLLPVFGGIASWPSLGPFALLLRIDFDQLTQDLPFPGVRDLLGNPEHEILVQSAEEFLDRAGDSGSTAEALHVHRTTLYHRLKRVESVTGLSLDDGMDRLTLHLALKLARINTAHRSRS